MTTLATHPLHERRASAARARWWSVQRDIGRIAELARSAYRRARLAWLARTRVGPGATRIAGLSLRYDDPASLRFEFKHIFIQRLYDFRPTRPGPRVIDGGAHIGLSALRIKRLAPDARITAFEPDPRTLGLLRENLAANGAHDVEVVEAALAGTDGVAPFAADGSDGGALTRARETGAVHVRTVRLSPYLAEPVDFLKLNIEGAELDVVRECGPALGNVRQLAIEYHGFPELGERLGELLNLLADAGFRCVVHGFDRATNPAGHPPFRIHADTRWFALIAAARDVQELRSTVGAAGQ